MTSDLLLRRLRWVMVCVITLDVIITLFGQPPFYWRFPVLAEEYNQLARAVLKHGWTAFILAAVLYTTAAFIIVSTTPRRLALVVLFSVIMGHYFGASSWLVLRLSLGTQAAVIYAITISIAFVMCGVGNSVSSSTVILGEAHARGKGSWKSVWRRILNG